MKRMMKFTERDLIVGLAAVIGGLVSTIVVALPLEVFLGLHPILAGIVEEPAKVIALIIIALVLPEWLTLKSKCALFGGLAGLGFAFIENLWYYLGILAVKGGITPELIYGRTLLSLPFHIFVSATAGMGLLYIAAKGKEGYKNALGLLFVAIILHGLWNAIPALGWFIFVLFVCAAVFSYIYKKLPQYPVSPEQIGVLRLPTREIWVTRNERTFGRNDFRQDVFHDEKLQYISKKHFRIVRSGDGFYIEDCNSTSGTKLDRIEIKGKGRLELDIGSEITLPADLKIEFTTKAKRGEIERRKTLTLHEKPTVEAVRIASKPLAKLLLPNNREIEIKEEERIFGREDFRGAIPDEELQHISRKHFKITRVNGEFYIEDEGSVNGTMLNGEEIKGLGMRKLKDGDEILVAKVLRIRYVEGQVSI